MPREGKNVQFRSKPTIATFQQHHETTILAYNLGADKHYLSKKEMTQLGLPILRISYKQVGGANDGACSGKYVTTVPFPQLSNRAAESDTLEEFPSSLMSVGKTAENGNVSIFTKYGVTVYK